MSALELKCSESQLSNRDLTESLERERSSARSAEAAHQQQLFEEEKKRLALETVVKEVQTLLEESKKETSNLTVEREKLQQEIAAQRAIPPPPPPKGPVEDPDVVAALRADIGTLQNEKEELVRKLDTIEERYKNGDLVCPMLLNLHSATD